MDIQVLLSGHGKIPQRFMHDAMLAGSWG